MPDRWPATMSRTTAAEYLDLHPGQFDKIARAESLPAMRYTERGDRYYLREDLDAMIADVRKRAFKRR